MDEMKIRDYDDFRSPNKGPWLIIILIILIAVVVLQRRSSTRDEGPDEPVVTPDNVEQAIDLKAPAQDKVSKPFRSGDVNAMLKEAREMVENTALVPARLKYLALLEMDLKPEIRTQVENEVGKINVVLATTPLPWPDYKVTYVVKSGDRVEKIARDHGTTIDLVKVGNRLQDANLIKKGDLFRILKGNFTIEVSKSRNDLVVYLNNTFFKRYRVGTGKFGKTPAGECVIDDKQKEPVWWKPDGTQVAFTGDPKGENILGTRWMSLKYTTEGTGYGGYGIHGTWNNESIGKAESAGCVRMRNSEVEELYTLIPMGTKVTIVE